MIISAVENNSESMAVVHDAMRTVRSKSRSKDYGRHVRITESST